MSEDNKAVQGDNNTETNNSTQAAKNNDVPYSRFQEVNEQKNDYKKQMDSLQNKLGDIEASQSKAREEKMIKNEEYTTLIAEKDAEISRLSGIATEWNTYQENTKAQLIEHLPENKREFADGMPLEKLQKYVSVEVQATVPNAGKTNSSRAGVTPSAGHEFGGYASYEEWASKDPAGCEKHLADTTVGFIR